MRKRRQRRKRKSRGSDRLLKAGLMILILLAVVLGGMKLTGAGPIFNGYRELEGEAVDAYRPDMEVELLTPNPYSRPETGTSRIRNIVIHYTAIIKPSFRSISCLFHIYEYDGPRRTPVRASCFFAAAQVY